MTIIISVCKWFVPHAHHPLQSFNFLKKGDMTDFLWGADASAVGMFSGCSIHNLCGIPASCNFDAICSNCASSGASSTTFLIWSKFPDEQYSAVSADSLLTHKAAVAAWHPCATMLPRGQLCSFHRSLRRATYCKSGSSSCCALITTPFAVWYLVLLIVLYPRCIMTCFQANRVPCGWMPWKQCIGHSSSMHIIMLYI